MTGLSIIIPVINEAKVLPSLLDDLKRFYEQGIEIVFVDGGSDDGSEELIENSNYILLHSSPGRAKQMNFGAQHCSGDILLFLHADTRLPEDAAAEIFRAIDVQGFHWGRFDVTIEGRSPLLKMVGLMINVRSRLSKIATGDQGIFVRRDLFKKIGGFPDQRLMEDIELCKRLKHHSAPACLTAKVITSGRRWDERGVWATIFLMWRLRWQYWRGVPADIIAEAYR